MSDFRDTPAGTSASPGTGARPVSPTARDDTRSRGGDQFEHERIGIHNEAQTVGSGPHRQPIRSRSSAEREALAERIADRLDVPITAAGVIFLLLVLAETISNPKGGVGALFAIASWVLWALFVAEFLLRIYVAPSTSKFLKRNWWQLIFLAVPALRFVRALRALRAARVGRVLSSAVRSSRTAGRTLSSRLGALGVTTIVVVLASSQLLFELGEYDSYGDALDDAALATVAGEPFFPEHVALRVVQIVVISYSVVVFAALAGTVGAFLLERRDDDERRLRRRQRDEVPTDAALGPRNEIASPTN